MGWVTRCDVRNWQVNERKALKAVFCDIVDGIAGGCALNGGLGRDGRMEVARHSKKVAMSLGPSVRKKMALPSRGNTLLTSSPRPNFALHHWRRSQNTHSACNSVLAGGR